MVFYSQFYTKFPEFSIIKLLTIIRDDHLWDSKPTNNVFPDEALYLSFSDYCQWFCFNSIGEVINSNEQELNLFLPSREWANDVNPPYGEWPR